MLLLLSTILWLAGTFWPWGWVSGGVLLLFPLHYLAQKRTFFAQIVKNVNLSARTFTEH